MDRHVLRAAVVAVAAAPLLLAACSEGEPSSAPGATSSPRSSETAGPPDPPDVVETTRPDGVMVLSRNADPTYVALGAGRYAVPQTNSLFYEVEVFDGWDVFAGAFFNTSGISGGIHFVSHAGRRTGVPTHPCRDHTLTTVGPGVRDLADALARQPLLEVSRPRPVTVDGRDGLFLTVTVPAHVDSSGCESSAVVVYSPSGRAGDTWQGGSGYVGRLWILDVDGERYVVHAECSLTCTDEEVDTLIRMSESITFTRVPD